jgi:hypothetical protein
MHGPPFLSNAIISVDTELIEKQNNHTDLTKGKQKCQRHQIVIKRTKEESSSRTP